MPTGQFQMLASTVSQTHQAPLTKPSVSIRPKGAAPIAAQATSALDPSAAIR